MAADAPEPRDRTALIETALLVGGLHVYFLVGRPSLGVDLAVVGVAFVIAVAIFRRRGESLASLGIALDARAARALRLVVPLALVALVGGALFRWAIGPFEPKPLWPGLLYAVLLYPVWGFLQQLLYLGLVQRGLARGGVPAAPAALIAALLYGLVHAPNWPLVLASTPLGLYLAFVWLRARALLPIAFGHGIAGAAAIYLVGLDLEIGATYVP